MKHALSSFALYFEAWSWGVCFEQEWENNVLLVNLSSGSDALSILSSSDSPQKDLQQWSERHLDLCATSTPSEKTSTPHLSFPDCLDRNFAIIAHCRLMINFTLWSCFDYGLEIIIIQLCSSSYCSSSHHAAWIETDGNDLQPLAGGLCSIDPIALIKVVYWENTATNDGWLPVIIRKPANITPLVYGVLTQSMKLMPNPGYFHTVKKSPWHIYNSHVTQKVQGNLKGNGSTSDGEMKRGREEASVYVIMALCPADLTKCEGTSGRMRINCILIIASSFINETCVPPLFF